jgi:hypothetical protein
MVAPGNAMACSQFFPQVFTASLTDQVSEVWRGIDRNDDDVQHGRRPWQKTLNGMKSATPDRVNFQVLLLVD